MPRTRVFVDTNIIIEAFRIGCWTGICHYYSIETVEKCIEEALTGDPYDRKRIQVDRNILVNGLAARHVVNRRAIASLVLNHPDCQGLDDGELHLLASLKAQGLLPNAPMLISTADKAAIVATNAIGGLASLESLERLALNSGITQAQVNGLARHYKSEWLSTIRMQILLKVIP